MEGTYPLPRGGSANRFTARISIGYPERGGPSLEMLDTHGFVVAARPSLRPVTTAPLDVRTLIEAVRGVLVAGPGEGVHRRVVRGDTETRPELRLGCVAAGPRCNCCAASRARAAPRRAGLRSSPTTIQALAGPRARRHRLLPDRRGTGWSGSWPEAGSHPGSSRADAATAALRGAWPHCGGCSGR